MYSGSSIDPNKIARATHFDVYENDELILEASSLTAKSKIEKKEIKTFAQRGTKKYVSTGQSGSGTLKIYKTHSKTVKQHLDDLNAGVQTAKTITAITYDPQTGEEERIVLTGVYWDELEIINMDANNIIAEQSIPFTYESARIESVISWEGME